jgi:hypothetical protein
VPFFGGVLQKKKPIFASAAQGGSLIGLFSKSWKKLSYANTYNGPKLMFLMDAQCLTDSFKHIDVTVFSICQFSH